LIASPSGGTWKVASKPAISGSEAPGMPATATALNTAGTSNVIC
jgi:hypothetical protein